MKEDLAVSKIVPYLIGSIVFTCSLLCGCQGDEMSWGMICPDMNLLVYWDEEGDEQPIENEEDWLKRRHSILANMQLVMGPLPDVTQKVPLDVEVLEETELQGIVRKKVTFQAEENDRVPAYLFIPKGVKGRIPGILCLHQTTSIGKREPAGIGGNPNLHYAFELAERGYVTLAPDYPNFGEYVFNPYSHGYTSATMKGIWNHIRSVDLLEQLPEVDPARIGCIGHSLGGHNTMFLAVFDSRIVAMVSSSGFTSFCKYNGGNLSGWSHEGYMPRIASGYGNDARRMPFEFSEVVAALAPRPFFINAPRMDEIFDVNGVVDCIRAAQPVYELLGARDDLLAKYPAYRHEFPDEIRREAYIFLDQVLRAELGPG